MKKKKHLFLYSGIWLILFFGAVFWVNRYISRSLEDGLATADGSSAYYMVSLFSDHPNYLIQNEGAGGKKYWMNLSKWQEEGEEGQVVWMQSDGRGNLLLQIDVYREEERERAELWVCSPKENRSRKWYTYDYKEDVYDQLHFTFTDQGILMAGFLPLLDDNGEEIEKKERVVRYLFTGSGEEEPLPLPELQMAVDTSLQFCVTGDQGIWYMDRYGNGYHCGEDNDIHLVFQNDGSQISAHNIGMYPGRDGIYFYNVDEQKDYRVSQDGTLEELSREDLQALRDEGWRIELIDWNQEGWIAAVLSQENQPVRLAILKMGEEPVFIAPQQLPLGLWLQMGLILGVLTALLAAGLTGILLVIWRCYRRAAVIPVSFQIAAAALIILLAGNIVIRQCIQYLFYERQREAESGGLKQAAYLEAAKLDADYFTMDPIDVNYFEWNIVGHTLLEIPTELAYYQVKGEEIYPILQDNVVTIPARFLLTESELALVERCRKEKTIICGTYTDEQNQYLGAFAPVFAEDGTLVGMSSCQMDTQVLRERVKASVRTLNRQIFFCLFVLLMAVMLLVSLSLRPLKQLTPFLQALERNKLPESLPVKGHHEISSIVSVFNRMSENIREYIQRVEHLRQQYEPFVPQGLVELMGRDIRQLKPGDQVAAEASLAVIDMADFQAVKEGCGQEEMFRRINQSLHVMILKIREYGGQILSFYQGGMAVLFPGRGSQAVLCVQQILNELKDEASYHAGIDYRKLHLEVVGNEERMDFTVGQEDWQEVREMQNFSALHGLGLVAGSGLIQKMEEEGDRRLARFLGSVPIGTKALTLYEIPAEEDKEQFSLYLETAEIFDRGVKAYLQGNYQESREYFAQILRKNRYDKAAQMFFTACDRKIWVKIEAGKDR